MKKQILYEITSKLGSLEKEIFELTKKENKPKDILLTLKTKRKNYAYTTVMTVMDKLWRKGYLKRIKKGKTYYYSKIYPDKFILNNSCLYLTKRLITLFSPLKIFSHLFYLILIFPLINFINQSYFNGFFIAALFSLTVYVFLNSVFTLYFNGFFDYLIFLIKEPSLIFNYWLVNIHYWQDIFLTFFSLILMLFFIILVKKILNFKNHYQFKNI